MHAAISNKRADIAALCRSYGVKLLEVFGSAARGTDFDTARSDADFLVEFHPGGKLGALEEFFGLQEALGKALGRKVDLVESGAIRNPYLLKSINANRETVYAS